MENFQVYRDIQARTGGDIYIGVVGPVRTGKSTFIRRFMELVALPDMEPAKQAEVRDQLPLSGSGKLITTVEPKFIPKEAVNVNLGDDQKVQIRLIDCVGFLVKDASGHIEDGRERMVKTPWFEKAIPFHEAAETGTRKVIQEHATIGLVVTTDGSFGELPRENFTDAEALTINLLKKQGKPFLILVNSQMPYKEETQELVRNLQNKYGVTTMAANCEQLRKEDVTRILSNILYEFPVSEIQFFVPKWVEMLPNDHELKLKLLEQIREQMKKLLHIKNITRESVQLTAPFVQDVLLEEVSLSSGKVRIRIQIRDEYYYRMLSEMSGIQMETEYDLIHTMKELAAMKEQYVKVQAALESVRESGYGVVVPELDEIQIEEPSVIRQGSKYGVRIKSKSPSIHMIKANIETEIAPIVGTEQQAKDLIQYIGESGQRGESIWETNIFGKSIEQLVQDGIRSKLTSEVLGATVNVVRSIPFLILLIFLLPLSALIVGTKIGTEAVVIPLAVAAVAFFARLSEASLAEVDKGMIEAAFASGAGKLKTMFCIVLPEAHVPLVKDITITAISLLGFSAMAGLVGGGGLGDLAYRYGYQRYNAGIMIACIAVLVVLVQIIQAAGDRYANRIERRRS